MPDHRAVSKRDLQALAGFRRALRAFLSFSERVTRDAGLTATQYQLLLAIGGDDFSQAPTIGELASSMMIGHQSMVELLDRAVGSGLLRRVPDEFDRRRQRVELTPQGADKLVALASVHSQELRRLHGDFLVALNQLL